MLFLLLLLRFFIILYLLTYIKRFSIEKQLSLRIVNIISRIARNVIGKRAHGLTIHCLQTTYYQIDVASFHFCFVLLLFPFFLFFFRMKITSSNRLIFVLSDEINWTKSSFYSAGKSIIRLNECVRPFSVWMKFLLLKKKKIIRKNMFHFFSLWFESIIILFYVYLICEVYCFHLISSQLRLIHPFLWSNWNGFLCVGMNCVDGTWCVYEEKLNFIQTAIHQINQDRWWISLV